MSDTFPQSLKEYTKFAVEVFNISTILTQRPPAMASLTGHCYVNNKQTMLFKKCFI